MKYNHHFQCLLDSISDSVILSEEQLFVRLRRLGQIFEKKAIEYGRTIISELHFPDFKKTIKPKRGAGWGTAGGDKYLVDGILFKFAVDSKGIYGSDELAAKEAGHQLRALCSLMNCVNQSNEIRFPLLVLIDYRGYRLIAMSKLPLNSNTLVYGSSDGGNSVITSGSVTSLLQRISKRLNIKRHFVLKTNNKISTRQSPKWDVDEDLVEISFPTDIECHKGILCL